MQLLGYGNVLLQGNPGKKALFRKCMLNEAHFPAGLYIAYGCLFHWFILTDGLPLKLICRVLNALLISPRVL